MRVGVMMGSRFKDKVPERQPFGDLSMAKKGIGYEDSGVAEEGGAESGRRFKRRRKSQLQGGNAEASSEVGGQPEAGELPSADGEHAGAGEG